MITCRMPGCGAQLEHVSEMRGHYLSEHPGEKSPTSRSRRKRDPELDVDALPLDGADVAPDDAPPDGNVVELDERRPAARRNLRDVLGKRKPASSEPATRERRPGRQPRKAGGKRESTAELFTLAWGGIGWIIGRGDVPVGRALQFQAPAAGDTLDRLTKDTVIDRVLQPFARRVDETRELSALVGLPILVGMIERSPAMAVVLEQPLREAIAMHLPTMARVVKRQRDEAAKAAAACVELGIADPSGGGDPIGAIIEAMFASVAPPAGEGAEAVAS